MSIIQEVIHISVGGRLKPSIVHVSDAYKLLRLLQHAHDWCVLLCDCTLKMLTQLLQIEVSLINW